MLLPEISTPNIYEHYRKHGWEESAAATTVPTTSRPVEAPTPSRCPTCPRTTRPRSSSRTARRSGTIYRSDPSAGSVFDYHRADGSTYLRVPSFVFKEPETWPTALQRVGPDGPVLGEFKSVAQWFKRFVRHLSRRRADLPVRRQSRFSAQHLVPMRAKNIHIVYVLHNIHVAPPRLWSSDMWDIYGRLVGQGRRHRRVRDADRPAAGRHRPAAGAHHQPVRDPQPGRHARRATRTCRRGTRTG